LESLLSKKAHKNKKILVVIKRMARTLNGKNDLNVIPDILVGDLERDLKETRTDEEKNAILEELKEIATNYLNVDYRRALEAILTK
jgi:hypothetical protein